MTASAGGVYLKLESLNEFCVLADTRSYWKASERLFVSQSTLSRHIKELENDLGVTLFARSTRNVKLTRFGLILLPYAKKMLQIEAELNDAFSQWIEITKNTLNIGVTVGWGENAIAEQLAGFQAENLKVRVDLSTCESTDLYEMLDNNACDFAFVREENESHDDHFSRIPVFQDCLMVYMAEDNPLAKEKHLSLKQLSGKSFMMSDESSLTYLVGTRACRESGFEPDILFSGNRIQTIHYLMKGIGIALLFGELPTGFKNSGIVGVPLEPPIYVYINLLYKPDAITPIMLSFLEHLLSTGFIKPGAINEHRSLG